MSTVHVPHGGGVYLLQSDRLYKIGRSVTPRSRCRAIRRTDRAAWIVHVITTNNQPQLEWLLHQRYAAARQGGEWFSLSFAQIMEIRSLRRVWWDDTGQLHGLPWVSQVGSPVLPYGDSARAAVVPRYWEERARTQAVRPRRLSPHRDRR